MENILKQLGYSVSETKNSSEDKEILLFTICNGDGTPRWIWPQTTSKPLFLKFYYIKGLKSFLFSFFIKIVFLLKLQALFFKKKKYFINSMDNKSIYFDINGLWSLFTGTAGPNNKGVICIEENNIISFIKIALTKNSEQLLSRESDLLNVFSKLKITNFQFPKIYNSSETLLQISNVSENGRRKNRIQEEHINALNELVTISSSVTMLNENFGWNKIKSEVRYISNINDARLPKGLIRKLDRAVQETNEFNEIHTCLSHGDFTPWNMFSKNRQLYIYDWELADTSRPLGFDLFHFIIQQGILVEHKNWKSIKEDINTCLNNKLFNIPGKLKDNSNEYLKMYLIYNITYYLKIYSEQKKWHKQVNWLFNIWNEALSDVLREDVNHRHLLLADTFDFLKTENYAAIKFQNIYPENLNEFSDVDLLTDLSTAKKVKVFLSDHPLVNRINVIRKSFMSTYYVSLKDGNFLSIDLLWKVKVKSLEVLDTSVCLRNAYLNNFGVKMLDAQANARYIGLFYGLNNASIPAKFNHYEEILRISDHVLDHHLFPFFIGDYSNKSLVRYVNGLSVNKGFKGFKNKLSYLFDTFRGFYSNKGFIITFSGVDGAGKSTVIEKIKFRVEKQLRKRVIVLRHRPSLLPILSVWTKGSARAQQDVLSTLPRTGENKNFLSSILRFAYYFLDYFFGQFLIYTKYVWRGYVVIYDRYYFDFINDGKRSNIILPEFITKSAFKLLIKPKVNFFLYADAEVILTRKKELNKETIDQLTSRYLAQFKELSNANSQSGYISINNTNLNETLETVFNKVAKLAA